MSASDGGQSESVGPTPTLNNLLSKPASGNEFTAPSPKPTTDAAQNGAPNKQATNPQVSGVQQQEWQQPQSPRVDGTQPVSSQQQQQQQQTQQPQTSGPPTSGYPPHGYPHPGYMNRAGMPQGYMYPPGPGAYPHPGQNYQYPPHMRPPGPGMPTSGPSQPSHGDFVRMPPGPNPLEWSAQQKRLMEVQGGNPSTPASIPAPSPAPSSVHEDSLDEKSRMESPSWQNQQRTPNPAVPTSGPPSAAQQQQQQQQGLLIQAPPHMIPNIPSIMPVLQRKDNGIVDKLVGPPTPANPPRVMPERRAFFERLVAFCDQHGEALTMVPQVSKQNVDLHRLYIAVRNRGGFEQVTKDKAWKNVCAEANPDISESSAAGYQLRKHYQKHLLRLECLETGKDPEEALAFADKLKRQRRKDPPAQAAQAAVPPPQQQQAFPGPPGQGGPPGYPPGPHVPGDPAFYHQPPYGPPGAYPPGPPGAYPPGAFGRMPPGTPMRPPHPQQHMAPPTPAGENNEQQSLQVPSQNSQPATPASQMGPASVQPSTPQASQPENGSQSGSRATSTGPQANASTPESSSRMSGGGEAAGSEQRPDSAALQTSGSQSASATPAPSVSSSAHGSQPSTSMAMPAPGQPGGPPPGQYYGQPGPMYPGGAAMRPGPPGPYPPGYPNPQYHPGAPPGHPNHYPHPAAHPSHPQHQHYLQQQQMWQQRGYPPQGPPSGQPMPMNRNYYGGRMAPPTQIGPAAAAASPGGSKIRYPPQPPPSHTTHQTPQRPMMPPGFQPQQASQSSHASSFANQPPFPAGSIEATTLNQKRRRKLLARDLINATPTRMVMALRSGLETEAVWAINALNVLLYDDTCPHPQLNQMPGLLNVVIEQFWATLSVLFPDKFPLSEPSKEPVKLDESELDFLTATSNGNAKQDVKHLVHSRNTEKKTNYTKQSRTGRKIQVQEAEMPPALKRKLMMEQSTSTQDETLMSAYVQKRNSYGLGGGLAERIAVRLNAQRLANDYVRKPRFSLYDPLSSSTDAVVPSTIPEVKHEKEEDLETTPVFILHRRAKDDDLNDGPNDYELKWPRNTALGKNEQSYSYLAMRALALSNILRGFSFLPGNEGYLCKHNGLHFMIGKFLHLLAEEQPLNRVKPHTPLDLNAPVPEPESYEVAKAKAMSFVDDDDTRNLLLVVTAQQLRDDAFVMLCHMSATLDLYDSPEEMSYPIYDGLLRWTVSAVPEALDPIPPAGTSARNYALEVLCKMSVCEKNIDMILSTGGWPRIEKFVHVLSKLLNMSEESHNREFAIVILNALCNASDAVCYVAAHDTLAITYLIAFIESSDQNMHHVMTTHGMPALRDNPEMMGTSVGMLRRAATMLKILVKVPGAYKSYTKHQQRLLQFTMSQLMDSRVAGMIADTLFEVQQSVAKAGPEEEILKRPKKEKDGVNGVSEKDESNAVKVEPTENSEVSADCNVKETGSPEELVPVAKSGKRGCSRDESPPTKRSCIENGYGEKKNGIIEKTPLQLKESRTDNGSMAVVA